LKEKMPNITIRRNTELRDIEDDDESPIQVILIYFDKNKGPVVYLASPSEVKPSLEAILVSLLDLDLPEGFFEYNLTEENLTLGNMLFNLRSEWARGEEEILMLSVVLRNQQKFSRVKAYFTQLSWMFQSTPNLFKGFYKNSRRDDPEIQEKYEFLRSNIDRAEILLRYYLNQIDMGRVLVLGSRNAGKTTLMTCLSTDPLTAITQYNPNETVSINFKKIHDLEEKNQSSYILNPGKHVIDFFLDQVQFVLYDIGKGEKPPESWLSYFKNPIGIILVFDLTALPEEQKEILSDFRKVLVNYSSEYSDRMVHPKMPILILLNRKDLQVEISDEEIVDMFAVDNFSFNSRLQFASTTKNEGIQEALKWFVAQLLFL
jgi:GTPase SAR1 family protein